jgi:hypothetical protein
MRYATTFLLCLLVNALKAQDLKTFKVNPGQRVYDVIAPADRYAFPEFESGIVLFRNGNLGGGRMNYNAVLADMEFIGDKGDTLSLIDRETIRHIVIRSDTFFVDKLYLQKVARQGRLVLARSRVIMISNHRRVGAMGQESDASVDAFTTLSASNSPLKNMVAQEILTYKEHQTFFLGNAYGKFRQVNRKNLSTMFGGQKREVENYLRERNPNFFLEADMRALFGFLAALDQP